MENPEAVATDAVRAAMRIAGALEAQGVHDALVDEFGAWRKGGVLALLLHVRPGNIGPQLFGDRHAHAAARPAQPLPELLPGLDLLRMFVVRLRLNAPSLTIET